jgi:hypothetical protein
LPLPALLFVIPQQSAVGSPPQIRVPHLHDGLIVDKVGIRATREPESLKSAHAHRVKAIPQRSRRPFHHLQFCHRREPYLSTPSACDVVEQSIE